MILAFDDTDSPDGGCTTYALFQVLAALPDLAPRGMPRLVRLNPNVPWKTRGNGAVCVELVRPTGAHVVVGEWQGLELRAYPDGEPAQPDEATATAAWNVLQQLAQPDAVPAMALFDAPPSTLLYWQAVRTLVEPDEALGHVAATDILHRHAGDGRALIGCLAAAAWAGPASSYEFIAYRERTAWGTPRHIHPDHLFGLDRTGITFHTEDPEEESLCCVPNTPCPVLLGLRGRNPEQLLQTARSTIPLAAGEALEGWILWASNQASGDHVTPVEHIQEAEPGMTIQVDAVIENAPADMEGGHVQVVAVDAMRTPVTLLAFEPTKSFRAVVRQLLPGDHVTATGGWSDGAVRMETLCIHHAVSKKIANPICCDKSMKSRGEGAGYKCAKCGNTTAASEAPHASRKSLIGAYEVPVMARRHLHRPLAWTQE